jgi:EAL domain-containing protein (putative c-di-GMP-specific phosphodiesterase class I)
LGELSPITFIPLAEETGLIVEIGSWVLDEALRNVAQWRRNAPDLADLTVAVNLSALQLRDENLVDRVAIALSKFDLPGDALVLELTESVLLADASSATSTFSALKRLGVRLAIDDFGTEYSSFAYLKKFPFDILKIDRSFVIGLGETDNADETLIAAIVAMAKGLGITTVAEGVETAIQASRAVALGCDAIQGFLYSSPVNAEQVEDVLGSLPGWAELVITSPV